MKRLVTGSIVCIPLLKNLGYAYAKYIDMLKVKPNSSYPDLLKVYAKRTQERVRDIALLNLDTYLISPILVAGLRPTLREGLWEKIGKIPIGQEDNVIPDFKQGGSSDPDNEPGKWYLIRDGDIRTKVSRAYDKVKYLQPIGAAGTGNIEIRLTMYFLLKEGRRIEDHFDLKDEGYLWHYNYISESPSLK